MKACNYYEKYKEAFEENPEVSLTNLRNEMMDEAKQIMEIRHVSTKEGEERVMREQVNKWNAVVRLFEKDGVSPIRRDDLIRRG